MSKAGDRSAPLWSVRLPCPTTANNTVTVRVRYARFGGLSSLARKLRTFSHRVPRCDRLLFRFVSDRRTVAAGRLVCDAPREQHNMQLKLTRTGWVVAGQRVARAA